MFLPFSTSHSSGNNSSPHPLTLVSGKITEKPRNVNRLQDVASLFEKKNKYREQYEERQHSNRKDTYAEVTNNGEQNKDVNKNKYSIRRRKVRKRRTYHAPSQ